MIYPDNIEQKLDFHVLREALMGLCTSSLGRGEVEKMSFLTSFDLISRLLQETKEMLAVISDASLGFPDGEMHDLSEPLARIRIDGLFLDEQELFSLAKTAAYAHALHLFFASLDSLRFPVLAKMAVESDSDIGLIPPMVDHVLDKYGQMRDSASPELARIRRELTQAQGSVAKAVQAVLRRAQAEGWLDKDAAPTMREGRMVLPVSPAFRRKIGGIVHDESATGKTVFVEPQEVVEANNRIRSLESEERRERTRILIDVSARLRPLVPSVLLANRFLAHIDFLRAKALLAKQLHAVAPFVEDAPLIDWHDARHAVLYLTFLKQGKAVVPLSLRLEGDKHILVISGPNAGGKSVCIKTVALLQYMLQCGLLVPMAEHSRCGVFSAIMMDIGDEQSLLDDLSTYSSHLRNMKFFLRNAAPDTLFLIDEFGSGTEPLIGGAIAEAVLRKLCQQKAFGLVTTHYTNLKHLAESTPGIINGAMLYDRGALRPLFQLSVGQAGSSFAIEIARQTGLGEDIIAEAAELVGTEHLDYDRSLQDIARDKRYWANKRQNIRLREKHLEEKIAFYEAEIAALKDKRKAIVLEAKAEAADILDRSNAVIERTIREIKESKADKQKTLVARQKVEKLKEEVRPPEQPKVLRDLRDLRFLTKTAKAPQTNIANTIHRRKVSFERTLDMRGMRVDEAMEQLVAYIDDAVMVGAQQVTILHGTGTGALKQMTREYLERFTKKSGRISSFHDGDPDHGGAGVTIVEI
ncbi:MAG: Smr/MutS family protein [Paludibacteraceae bacterium]|nr:Smr/MutS family protein [Paludibacteraceae bacterium]